MKTFRSEEDRTVFDAVRVALWDEDFSELIDFLDGLKQAGVLDPVAYLTDRPDLLRDAVQMVRVAAVNNYAVELFEADSKPQLLGALGAVFLPETHDTFLEEIAALWKGEPQFAGEATVRTLKGKTLDILISINWLAPHGRRALVSIADNSKQKAVERRLNALNEISKILLSPTDFERTVQAVTDICTRVAGAEFGAFFYNIKNEAGESYQLYALSGVPRAAFEKFPLPRNTAVFEPTFRGEGIVRSDDITKDLRYGRNRPHHGMPAGHLPVVSYLAVPVKSPSGEVHGGLFFGHGKPGKFSGEVEAVIQTISSQVAFSIERMNNQRALIESEQRLNLALSAGKLGAFEWNIKGNTIIWSPSLERIHGLEPGSFDGTFDQFKKEILDEDLEAVLSSIQHTIASGEPYHAAYRAKLANNQRRWLEAHGELVRDSSGRAIKLVGVCSDITDRKKSDDERALLLAELNHRVKNTLATVLAIQHQTFARSSNVVEARAAFESRISALANAHTRLAETNWLGVSLNTLISQAVLPYRRDFENVQISGPDIILNAKAALTMGLAFHELATNAAKYGSLSVPEGALALTWNVGANFVKFSWVETKGPPIEPPSRVGFGRMLLERGVRYDLEGSIRLHFERVGFACEISLPSSRVLAG